MINWRKISRKTQIRIFLSFTGYSIVSKSNHLICSQKNPDLKFFLILILHSSSSLFLHTLSSIPQSIPCIVQAEMLKWSVYGHLYLNIFASIQNHKKRCKESLCVSRHGMDINYILFLKISLFHMAIVPFSCAAHMKKSVDYII